MPIIKSAIKKMKQDKKRRYINKKRDNSYILKVKQAKKTKKLEDIKSAFSSIDKGVKYKRIHKNKAARLKSSVAREINKKS